MLNFQFKLVRKLSFSIDFFHLWTLTFVFLNMLHKWIRIPFSVDFVHNCADVPHRVPMKCADVQGKLISLQAWCNGDTKCPFKPPLRYSDTCVNHVMMSASEACCLLCCKDVVVQTQAYFVNSIERGWLESSKKPEGLLLKGSHHIRYFELKLKL